MKFKKLAMTVALFMSTLGWSEPKIKDQKLDMSDEEKDKMQKKLGDTPIDQVLELINKEISDFAKSEESKTAGLEKAKEELSALLDQAGVGIEEKNKLLDPVAGAETKIEDLISNVTTEMSKKFEALQDMVQKLSAESEGDSPLEIIKNAMNVNSKIQHSASHLFASNHAYDAFEGRPWNKKAAGIATSSVDFSDKVQVDKLAGDLELYYRENPDKITSLNRDNFGLPDFWPKRLKVDDRVSDGFIATAEITQARKLPWLPKNKQKITAEEGRIYPVQIDAEFIGFNLQKMESSWLNKWNKEGSQAYKMSFVAFLVSELDKQARVEDRKSSIGGIYVPTPDDATVPGRAMNRQDGLLYQLWKAINVTGKLMPFSLGTPTTANIVDYVDDMIKALPGEIRETANLKFYLSREWIRAYKRRYEAIHGSYSDYDGYPENPKDFGNIDFVPIYDLSGTDIMFITFPDNIEILENIPEEKGKYHFEMLKRIMYVFADYKLGIRLIHIGTKIASTDPDAFKVQSVWSNNVPLFKADFFIPTFDDATGVVNAKYSNLEVEAGFVTAVTEISGTYAGQVIRLRGNTALAGATNVTNGAKITLTGGTAFNLKTGGTLTLLANGNGTVKEIKRTAAPETAPAGTIEFSATTFDATAGSDFAYKGAAATLASITGGVEGQVITITNNSSGNLTVANAASISVASTAVMTPTSTLELVLVDGKWTEKSRTIV